MLYVVSQVSEEVKHNAGDVIAVANGPVTNKIFLVKSGEVVLVPADVPLPGKTHIYAHIQTNTNPHSMSHGNTHTHTHTSVAAGYTVRVEASATPLIAEASLTHACVYLFLCRSS